MHIKGINQNKRKMKKALCKAVDEIFDQIHYTEKAAVAHFGKDDIDYDVGTFSAKLLLNVLPHEATNNNGFELFCQPMLDLTPKDGK